MNGFDFASAGLSAPDPNPPQEMDLGEQERLDRIESHISKCGRYFHRPDPTNGRRLIAYQSYCQYWRYGCLVCLERRAKKFSARFRRCIRDVEGEEFLGIAQMSADMAKNVIRRMRKAGVEYWRIPTEYGTILIFDLTPQFESLNNPDLHDSLDWNTLCQTPEKSRYSGTLGEEKREEKIGIVVRIPQYQIEGLPNEQIDSAWSVALKNTAHLDPAYDVDEIEEALQERMDEFGMLLMNMGGELVEEFRVMARVDKGHFGWTKSGSLETKSPSKMGRPMIGVGSEAAVRAVEELFDG